MSSENTLRRRRFLEATGGAAATIATAGCLSGGGDDEATGDDNPSNEFSLINSTMTTLDPIKATDTASGTVIQQVFDSLTNYENGQQTVSNLLADSYEISDDFKTLTFSLKDATFHNGDQVTASDFVYSFERLAASDNSRRAYFILDSLGLTHETETVENEEGEETKQYKANTLGVEAVDDSTLKLELDEPFASSLEMLAYTSFSAIPEGIVGDIDGYDGEMDHSAFESDDPIGAGPFEFDTWETNSKARVTRFDDYHGSTANVEAITWQIIEDPTAQYNRSMNKKSDLVSMPTTKYSKDKVTIEETKDSGLKLGTYGPLRNGETANYSRIPAIGFYYVGFNMAKVPKPVRKAFAYTMNQKQMVEQVFKGRGRKAYHSTPPAIYPGGAKDYQKHAKESYPYGYDERDLDKAQEVMEEAGYGPDNKFEIEWTQYESDTWKQMAKTLQGQLRKAHINMNISSAPFSTLTQRGRNGDLEVYTLGWIADWPAPENFLQLLNPPQTDTSRSDPISYLNWTEENGDAAGRAKKAWQKVLDNPAPTDEDTQARNEAYVTMEEANWEDVGFLNVYHSLNERLWYDWVDIEPPGAMGGSRQKYNNVSLESRE
jgi:peptide/nickel transport system substrate-binding protein